MEKLGYSRMALVVSVFCAAMTIAASAQTFTTLAKFDQKDGGNPVAGPLVQGPNGNLYGTSSEGGTNCNIGVNDDGCGSVFEVTPAGKLAAIYSFCPQVSCTDGESPQRALVLAANGNFYGSTLQKGMNGYGTIFEVTPAGKLTTLYSFCFQTNCADGVNPSRLLQAADGNFYGETEEVDRDAGTVFEITATGNLTTLYSFCSQPNCADGEIPWGGLVQGTDGNFYGVTNSGGPYAGGNVFKLSPNGSGGWTENLLYSFCAHRNTNGSCTDGGGPEGALLEAPNGNFYGTTVSGGANGLGGTVFEVTPDGTLTTLYNFCSETGARGICLDGSEPAGQLVQASDGNFYGTTSLGGVPCNSSSRYQEGCGTAFRITPAGEFTPIYNFCSQGGCPDAGLYPDAGLAQATNGTFYGLTYAGGDLGRCNSGGCGTIFSLSLGLPPFVEAVPNFGKAGRVVGILGNNLTGASSVTFNGTPATFTVISATAIKATVPTGVTRGKIEVVTPSGTLSSNVAFQVLP